MAKFTLSIEDVGEDQVTMTYDLDPDVSELDDADDATPTQLAGVAIVTLLLQHIFPQDAEAEAPNLGKVYDEGFSETPGD
jgi:hypothetical protein